jgi:methylphosphotriester-DNA--protein-cysteine methyltransferase
MVIESDEEGMTNTILPDTHLVLALRCKGTIAFHQHNELIPISSAVVTGIRKDAREVVYHKNASVMLIVFREGGAAAFFKEPAFSFAGESVALNYLFKKENVEKIEAQLAEAKNNALRFHYAEQFLLSHINHGAADTLIQYALQEIKRANGNIRIDELLASLPISRDPFEKRFKKFTGTSPKQFSKIVRLRHLIENYSTNKNIADAVYQAGYFDQSHFIKDFKTFTGKTPQLFFQSAAFW